MSLLSEVWLIGQQGFSRHLMYRGVRKVGKLPNYLCYTMYIGVEIVHLGLHMHLHNICVERRNLNSEVKFYSFYTEMKFKMLHWVPRGAGRLFRCMLQYEFDGTKNCLYQLCDYSNSFY